MGLDGIDERIAAGAQAIASALRGPAGQIPLDRVVIDHLTWFELRKRASAQNAVPTRTSTPPEQVGGVVASTEAPGAKPDGHSLRAQMRRTARLRRDE